MGKGGADGDVNEIVQQFVVYFYRHIRERNVYEIHSMYESSFSKLTERFFKDKPWPKVDAISHLTGDDHVFSMLYSEMYYRHVYARLQPTLEQRCESWDNYCELFKVILGTKINMQLPNSWLWDMVDDFIYQFQSYCAYRAKLRQKGPQEINVLRECVFQQLTCSSLLPSSMASSLYLVHCSRYFNYGIQPKRFQL
jgi:translation initiation factor 3 subunit L